MKTKATPDFACEWLMRRPRVSWHGKPDHMVAANGGQKVNSVAHPISLNSMGATFLARLYVEGRKSK
jgi:hypothetical protein